jgi:hypothetical protein
MQIMEENGMVFLEFVQPPQGKATFMWQFQFGVE